MKFLINGRRSQEAIINLTQKYNTALCLDDFIDVTGLSDLNFQKKLIESLHGPFFDLSPASRDPEIREMTMKRFNQIYNLAKAGEDEASLEYLRNKDLI